MFLSGRHQVNPAQFDAFERPDVIGQLFDLFNLAFQNDYLQAVMVVQMNMG